MDRVLHLLATFVLALTWHGQSVLADEPKIADVFILAGQSNAVGHGDIDDLPSVTYGAKLGWIGILNTLSHRFEPMRVGVNTVQWPQGPGPDTAEAFGPEWNFAKHYKRDFQPNYYRRAFFIKFARGGTSLLQEAHWNPNSQENNWFHELVYRVQRSIDGLERRGWQVKVHCLVWIQGEVDRRETDLHDEYVQNFFDLFDELKLVTRNDQLKAFLPLLKVPDGLYDDSTYRSFRRAQRQIAAESDNIRVLYTNDLTFKPDNVHYDTRSVEKIGFRAYKAWRATLDEGDAP